MDRTSFSSNFINEFEHLNKALNPTVHNSTITKGVTMKINKPDVRVEVELWQLTNGNNKELGIEQLKGKHMGKYYAGYQLFQVLEMVLARLKSFGNGMERRVFYLDYGSESLRGETYINSGPSLGEYTKFIPNRPRT